MAKLPRNVSGREVVQALKRAGFVFVRKSQKGHFILAKGETVISVPDHRNLKTGTLRQIVREAGLTVEEFTDLLAR
jgi:predicted RNA binding protein YcfA (HicA-like mRNA interferase family)